MCTRTSDWQKVGETLQISLPEDFDFIKCLRFLNRNSRECLHRVEGNRLRKLLMVSGLPLLLELRVWDQRLRIQPLNREIPPDGQPEVIAYFEELLDLNRDLSGFYSCMQGDPLMGALVKRHYGLRLIGIPDLFEALCWSVIGQQINLNFAYNLKQRLVQAVGSKLQWEGEDYFMFPQPQELLGIEEGDFSRWQFSRSKARYLLGIAREMAAGNLNKETLQQLPSEEVFTLLTSLKGIGPWSAHYVMMKCLHRMEAFPIKDVGLHNAVKHAVGNLEKPSLRELETLGDNWHPWQAYATFYLWHTLID